MRILHRQTTRIAHIPNPNRGQTGQDNVFGAGNSTKGSGLDWKITCSLPPKQSIYVCSVTCTKKVKVIAIPENFKCSLFIPDMQGVQWIRVYIKEQSIKVIISIDIIYKSS